MHVDNYLKRKIHEIPIESVVERLGIHPVKHKILCVFHQEKTPSLSFYPKNNTFKCFGCGASGDAVTLVMQVLNLSYPNACQWIANQFGIYIPSNGSSNKNFREKIKPIQKLPNKKEERKRQTDKDVLEWVISTARLSSEAKHFLFEERGYSKEVCEKLRLGSISNKEKFVNIAIKAWGKERCLNSGIIREFQYGLLPFARVPSILFPFYGEDDTIKNICGRYMIPDNKNRFLYIPNLDNDIKIFNLNQLIKTDVSVPVYISEGLTDCLALLSESKTAVAIPGAGSFKSEYVKYFSGRRLFMYPDHDEAGRKFFDDVNKKLRKFSSFVTELPYDLNCKDYSEYYKKRLTLR